MKEWCDIEDQDGFWKIGYIINNQQEQRQTTNIVRVRIDGYQPAFDTFYCKHAKKLFPVRTYTMGFNSYPSGHKVLREPLKYQELKLNHNRLTLIGRMQNLLENTEQNVKIFMRTQLLILVDKIIRTPFELINSIKMCDLQVNKLFIGIINFYLKILDSSKKFLPLIQSDNKMAKQLLLTMYQFSLIAKLIIGSHKNSKAFFEDPSNLTIKTDGFIDCFIMADNGILPFRIFFKNLCSVSLAKIDKKQIQAIFEVIEFFLDLCERSKGELFQSRFLPQTKIVVDQIINFMRLFAAFNQENQKYLKLRMEIINRLETLELKLKPKKNSVLRNQIFGDDKSKNPKPKQNEAKPSNYEASSQELQNLKKRIKKLEDVLGGIDNISSERSQQEKQAQNSLQKRTKNLGEQNFLASLNWALSCGDLETCKKLVCWRQNLLRLGRIVGWQTALEIGLKTMKKAQITHQDIISTNIQLLKRNKEKNSKEQTHSKLLNPLLKSKFEQKNNNKVIQPQKD